MKQLLVVVIGILLINSCQQKVLKPSQKDFTKWVNPFVGTSKMGHTFPGATAPFGMVQLSPQTNFEVMHNEDGSLQ